MPIHYRPLLTPPWYLQIFLWRHYPGSVNDRRIFMNSDIFKNIMANEDQYFSENTYILGDKTYPLLSWCLTPYINIFQWDTKQHQTTDWKNFLFIFRQMEKIEIFRHEPYRPDSSVSLLCFTQHMPQLSGS